MPRVPELCPICRKAAEAPTRPFCSPRCAQIDLGRWFGGQYAVPGRDGEAFEPAASEDE